MVLNQTRKTGNDNTREEATSPTIHINTTVRERMRSGNGGAQRREEDGRGRERKRRGATENLSNGAAPVSLAGTGNTEIYAGDILRIGKRKRV